MSYCRFSCDDFRSDVYVYDDDVMGGVTTIVASRRVVGVEMPPPAPEGDVEAHLSRWVEVNRLVRGAGHEDIGGPHDGARFNDATAAGALARLRGLREEGYHVPEHALKELEKQTK